MTVDEALALATAMRPCELDREVLIALLLDLEEQLKLEVGKERTVPRAVTRTELTVPAPFDRVYWTYLASMIDLAQSNTDAYRLTDALYRESREAYVRWHQRTVGQGR